MTGTVILLVGLVILPLFHRGFRARLWFWGRRFAIAVLVLAAFGLVVSGRANEPVGEVLNQLSRI